MNVIHLNVPEGSFKEGSATDITCKLNRLFMKYRKDILNNRYDAKNIGEVIGVIKSFKYQVKPLKKRKTALKNYNIVKSNLIQFILSIQAFCKAGLNYGNEVNKMSKFVDEPPSIIIPIKSMVGAYLVYAEVFFNHVLAYFNAAIQLLEYGVDNEPSNKFLLNIHEMVINIAYIEYHYKILSKPKNQLAVDISLLSSDTAWQDFTTTFKSCLKYMDSIIRPKSE